jgi:hypothetical protein
MRDSEHPLPRALAAEFEARAFYRRMSEAYGGKAPFPARLAASEKRIGWLTVAARRQGIACPTDVFSGRAPIASAWLADCTRGARGESALAWFYQRQLGDDAASAHWPLFGKLLRHSLNSQLPPLARAIAAASKQERFHAAHGIPPQEAYLEHGLFSTMLEKAFSVLGADHRTLGLFSPILRGATPALLAGMVFGGTLTLARKKKSSSKRKVG